MILLSDCKSALCSRFEVYDATKHTTVRREGEGVDVFCRHNTELPNKCCSTYEFVFLFELRTRLSQERLFTIKTFIHVKS